MFRTFAVRGATLAFSVTLMAGMGVMSAGAASATTGNGTTSAAHTVYVNSHQVRSHSNHSCSTARYTTIQAAVDAAASGGKVVVCTGTYHENVYIAKALTLKGQGKAAIEAVATSTQICPFLAGGPPILSPCLAGITVAASNVAITGLTVSGAQGEGILATGSLTGGSISHISITRNVITGNDTGGPTSAYAQCQGEEPDCGEGVHFMGVAHSVISNNAITGNSGGVLLTDEFGPTHDNVVSNNVVANNVRDCGITLPGHNPFAYDSATQTLKPKVAGVFDNTIKHNVVYNNGTQGFGAGIGVFVPIPGSAVYDNLITANVVVDNGLGGFTLHDHLPGGAYTSGNKIIGNLIGKNNLLGEGFDTNPPAPLTVPTGIVLYSGADPVTITIQHNFILNNTDGVWHTTNVTINGFGSNAFHNVTTPEVAVPPM